MSWFVAIGAGVGLGLAYFGGLWLTVRGVAQRPVLAGWAPVLGLVRLALLGAGLAILGGRGAGGLVAALGGIWLARSVLIHEIGGGVHGR